MWDVWAAVTDMQTGGTLASIDFTHPAVVGGLVGLVSVLFTKGIDIAISHRKARDDFRHSDRDLLSKDEKDFRLTIIKQLQECTDANVKKDVKITELSELNIELTKRVAFMELEIASMKTKVVTAMERGVEAAQQIAENVAEAVKEPIQKEKRK